MLHQINSREPKLAFELILELVFEQYLMILGSFLLVIFSLMLVVAAVDYFAPVRLENVVVFSFQIELYGARDKWFSFSK